MRLEIIADIDTKKSALDENEIKGDTMGFVKWILGGVPGIILEVRKAECIAGEGLEEKFALATPKKSWKEHFEGRFNRME